jgi:hypothetical protein
MSENYILEHLELGNTKVNFKHLTYDIMGTLGGLYTIIVTDNITNDTFIGAHNIDLQGAAKAIAQDINKGIYETFENNK